MTFGLPEACHVGIVDYQAGNIHSISNAFAHLGANVRRVRQPAELIGCTHLVLPGVGAFGFCADRLTASGLLPAIEQWAFTERRPLLGICVGMQLMADTSEESPAARGLGWIGGVVRRLPAGAEARVPHVGWNTVTFDVAWRDFERGREVDVYFDHSFACGAPLVGARVARCEHGVAFSAMIQRDNVVAVQFHPEKSQAVGLRILRGFLAS